MTFLGYKQKCGIYIHYYIYKMADLSFIGFHQPPSLNFEDLQHPQISINSCELGRKVCKHDYIHEAISYS